MAELLTLNALAAFATLAALEIVLGIDNLVFIAILTGKLPREKQDFARRLGLGLAALGRIVLIFAIAWVVTLEGTMLLDSIPFRDHGLSVKDLILVLGGLFLLGKATWEIHENLEGGHEGVSAEAKPAGEGQPGSKDAAVAAGTASFGAVLGQILALDLVFSIDSVLTAVGMVKPEDYDSAHFPLTSIPWVPLVIMGSAIVLAIIVMLFFVGPISRFVQARPTIKILALSFLVLIGVVLVAEGFHEHIPRGYIYFAMGFSLLVELLNLKFVKKHKVQDAGATH